MLSKNVGIDVGYGFVKATDGKGEHIFPSVVGVGQKLRYRSELSNHRRFLDNLMVSDDGRQFFVGDLAIRQSEIATRSLDQNRVQDRNVKILFLTGVGLFAEDETQSFNVVTGLPTSYYASYREGWQQALRGRHEIVFHLPGEDRRRTLEIGRLTVVPQPFGTLYYRVLNERGEVADQDLAEQRVGIIDVGFKTSDFAVADGMEFIERLSGSSGTGLSTAYSIISDRLAEELGLHKENFELDRVVEDGQIKIAGKVHDISWLKRETFERLAAKIITEVDSLWDYRDLDLVLVTGGGGQALAEYLLAEYDNASLVENAQVANVRGFLRLSNHLYQTG
ncbi:MAG: ParM/StbA family protein [Acetobacteraceae bacterium]|nr:ParM/StbA family protein [Acetobacteraceae bacterium]